MWEISEHKSVKVKRKLGKMDQVMDIVKLKKFNFIKKKVAGFG